MLGSFKDAFIWVTPRLQNGSAWTLDAEHVSYVLEEDGIITLRISRRAKSVKVECNEQAVPNAGAAKETGEPPQDSVGEDSFVLGPPPVPFSIPDANIASSSNEAPGQTPISGTSSLELQPKVVTVKVFSIPTQNSDREHPPLGLKRQKQLEGRNRGPYKKKYKVNSRDSAKKSSGCTVPNCTNYAVGAVDIADSDGPRGKRCKIHGGGRRCNVDGCSKKSIRRTLDSDSHGMPGSRCANHSVALRCSIDDCPRIALKGKVCGKHGGGPRCNVVGCGKMRVGIVDSADELADAGGRCWRHGGRVRKKSLSCADDLLTDS
eukprot:GEMP01022660.1.p1 GENE.GEMP01022660.1~~GEMP01022660.1.p1  ORF type:complete len:319 (+),score=59.19 GEMP01022660.1:112-1068(+)